MKVEWLAIAESDRASQLSYIGERNAEAAIFLGDAIQSSISVLSRYPDMGRPGRVVGTRELVVPDTPYIAVYRVEAATILILRLLHGAQRWPSIR